MASDPTDEQLTEVPEEPNSSQGAVTSQAGTSETRSTQAEEIDSAGFSAGVVESADSFKTNPVNGEKRKWILSLSFFWAPFIFSTLLTGYTLWRFERWIPGITPPLPLYFWLSVVLSITATVCLPAYLVLFLASKFARPNYQFASKVVLAVEIIGVSVINALVALLILKADAAADLNAGRRVIAYKICSAMESTLAPFKELRSVWFQMLANDIGSKSSFFLERALKLFLQSSPPDSAKANEIYEKLAKSYSESSDYEMELKYLNILIPNLEKQNPKDVTKLAFLKDIQRERLLIQNKFNEAEKVTDEILPLAKICSEDDRKTLFHKAVLTYEQCGASSKSEPILKELESLTKQKYADDKSADAFIRSIHAANIGNFDAALKWTETGLTELPPPADPNWMTENKGSLLRLKAEVLAAKGLLDEAESTIRSGLKFAQEDRDSLICLACIYDKRKRYSDADFIYAVAESTFPLPHSRLLNISKDRIKRMLAQLPPQKRKQLQDQIDYLKDIKVGEKNFARHSDFLSLEVGPVTSDLRQAKYARIPNGTAVEDGTLVKYIKAAVRSAKFKDLKWAQDWINKPTSTLKENLETVPLPGTILKPLTILEMLPRHFLIVENTELEKLVAMSGLDSKGTEIPEVDWGYVSGFKFESPERALTARQENVKLVQQIFGNKSKRSAIALNEAGEAYFALADYKNAESHYKRSLELLEDLHERESLHAGIVISNLAWLYAITKNVPAQQDLQLRYDLAKRGVTTAVIDFRESPFAAHVNTSGLKFITNYSDNYFGVQQQAQNSGPLSITFLGPQTTGEPYFPPEETPTSDDAVVIHGENSELWTNVSAAKAKLLLEQIPRKTAYEFIRFANVCQLGKNLSADLTRTILLLDLRPYIKDLRPFNENRTSPKRADQFTPKGEVIANVDGGVVITAKTARACLAKVDREKVLKHFSQLASWMPDGKLHKEDLPNPSLPYTPTSLPPKNLGQLVPDEYIILDDKLWKQLKTASGLSHEQLVDIRERYGPAELRLQYPPHPGSIRPYGPIGGADVIQKVIQGKAP